MYTYTILIDGLRKSGRLRDAQKVFEDNGCLPNAKPYEIIILSLFEKDENDKV
jgi:pentatricopeptide repeat protein